jgi:hypothetical protein
MEVWEKVKVEQVKERKFYGGKAVLFNGCT